MKYATPLFGRDKDIRAAHVNVNLYDRYLPTTYYAFGRNWESAVSADDAKSKKTLYRIVVKPKAPKS